MTERTSVIQQAREAALAEAGRTGWYPRRVVDAAVRVVLEHLIDRAKTHGDAGAVEAMYELEAALVETCS